jgi:hypothetical protein
VFEIPQLQPTILACPSPSAAAIPVITVQIMGGQGDNAVNFTQSPDFANSTYAKDVKG